MADLLADQIYAHHDGEELRGDLYLPDGPGPHPALVTVHGGGWARGSRLAQRHWGRYLSARGYAVFAASYRLFRPGRPTYPAAVHDVRAAVQFVRHKAAGINVDPNRIGLMGDSAGAHLAALVALAWNEPQFADAYPDDPTFGVSPRVKLLIANYGVYDLATHWQHELTAAPGASALEGFLGASLLDDRRLYFEASPLSYVTVANNALPVLLGYGTIDDVVDPETQTLAFLLALKQARFFVRTCVVVGAGHYWTSDPIEEAGSSSAHLATRLVRFLADHL